MKNSVLALIAAIAIAATWPASVIAQSDEGVTAEEPIDIAALAAEIDVTFILDQLITPGLIHELLTMPDSSTENVTEQIRLRLGEVMPDQVFEAFELAARTYLNDPKNLHRVYEKHADKVAALYLKGDVTVRAEAVQKLGRDIAGMWAYPDKKVLDAYMNVLVAENDGTFHTLDDKEARALFALAVARAEPSGNSLATRYALRRLAEGGDPVVKAHIEIRQDMRKRLLKED